MVTRRKKQTHSGLEMTADVGAFIERIQGQGVVTQAQVRKFHAKVREITGFTPRVGVFGKTGAGKSSLCNALFGSKIAKVSNVKACTRAPQEVLVNLTDEGAGMTLLDVPGVGESSERDDEYRALYESLLPELDLVLWVVKGDDRAMSIDQKFYEEVVIPAMDSSDVPVIFVLNQVDKIEPFREWDLEAHRPSRAQQGNIRTKVAEVRRIFKRQGGRKLPTVVPVAADEGYNLVALVDAIVEQMPDEKKYAMAREARAEHVSDETARKAKVGVWESVKKIAVNVFWDVGPPLIAKGLLWVLKKVV